MNDLPVLLRVRVAYFDMNIASILHAYIIIYIHTHLYIYTHNGAYVMNSYMRAHYMQALSSSHTQTHTYMCMYVYMYLRSQNHILESRLHKEQKQQRQQHTTRSDRNAAAE